MYYVKEVARDVAVTSGLTQVITLAVSAAGNNTLLIAAKVIIAVINAKGRPRRLPEALARQMLIPES